MNNDRKSQISYVVVFIVLISVFGYFSFANLVNFYVKDEVDYNEWTVNLGNKFETDEATTFFGKFKFVNFNGAVRNILGQREMNGILKLNNGHLVISEKKRSNEEIKAYADEVIKFADFCKEKGKPVLFVQPNLKIDADNKQLPVGTEDYSNENIDVFISYLKDAGIEVVDIRNDMKRDGLDLYDYTYVTDHHWNTEGCFYAFTRITDWIGNKTGIFADPRVTDIDNYEIKTYEKWHLGSYGQRVGEYFAGIDDYDLILPKFDVSFITDDGNSHTFCEQAVNDSVFKMRDAKSRYTYDWALQIPEGIASTSRDLSVLFVTDSYSTAMSPYLKLAYSEYYYQYYPTGLKADYVVESDPDVVILMPFNTSVFNVVGPGGTNGAIFIDATEEHH